MVTDVFLVFMLVAWVVCLHECLHIAGFLILRMEYRVSLIYKWHIPMAISLDSKEFSMDFTKMDRPTKRRYTFVALIPYTVIFPLFMALSGFGIVLRLVSAMILLMHALNLGLEFVDIRKALGVKGAAGPG